MSHFPLYVTQSVADLPQPVEEQPWWSDEACEYESTGNCTPTWAAPPAEKAEAKDSAQLRGLPANCPPACPKHGTPGTAELEPITSDHVQTDEEDMGMTYEELSWFGQ